MKISTLLYYIDHGSLALPCFARDYVWTSVQVRNLFNSLYREYPVGSLILWSGAAAVPSAQSDTMNNCSRVESVVDGHQRITAIYGVVRGRPTPFRPAGTWSIPPLCFHVVDQVFDFHTPSMTDDPLWIDLTDFFNRVHAIGHCYGILHKTHVGSEQLAEYLQRLSKLSRILDRNLAVEYVPCDASLEEAAKIHLIANGGGLRK